MRRRSLRIGTRSSLLALAQAREVASAVVSLIRAGSSEEGFYAANAEIEIVEIETTGDLRQGTEDARIPDKKMWVQEIEEAILRDEVDMAVHSSKDVPADVAPGTVLFPVLTREFPEDVFVAKGAISSEVLGMPPLRFEDLPPGAVIGTASFRRVAQLLHHRPDLIIKELRGNVTTRLRKLAESENLSGIVLARAGLERLGLGANVPYQVFAKTVMMPAANQGIMAVQFRESDAATRSLVQHMIRPAVFAVWQAERACVRALGADCHSALSVYGEVRELEARNQRQGDGELKLSSQVLSGDGRQCLDGTLIGNWSQSSDLGIALAEMLNEKGAQLLLHGCGSVSPAASPHS